MYRTSAFDDIACIPHGITVTNPAMLARIRTQSATMPIQEIAAHLANAIASANDAAHARDFEEAQFGEASAETLVDAEYYEDLASTWSLIASEHGIDSFDALLIEATSVH